MGHRRLLNATKKQEVNLLIVWQRSSKYLWHLSRNRKSPATSWTTDLIHFEELEKKDKEEWRNIANYFVRIFKYPKEFITNTKLRRIVLVKELYNQGVPVAAMPEYYKENLYMDIYIGNNDPLYQRHVVHHEFYHMIEQELNGDAYYIDPEWNKFNEPGFTYGSGGINNRTGEMRPLHILCRDLSVYIQQQVLKKTKQRSLQL